MYTPGGILRVSQTNCHKENGRAFSSAEELPNGFRALCGRRAMWMIDDLKIVAVRVSDRTCVFDLP